MTAPRHYPAPKPSAKQIAASADAMRRGYAPRTPVCHVRAECNGVAYEVWDSPYSAEMIVYAQRFGEAELSREVPDMDAARDWVGTL